MSGTRAVFAVITLVAALVAAVNVSVQQRPSGLISGQKWVATWAASVHGPYPSGNPSAQPDLKFAFPTPAEGAVDQSFRLIVKPDLWGDRFRIRLANTFGTQTITFDAIYIGVAASGGNVVKGTNRAVLFSGSPTVNISAGASAYSDGVDLKLPPGALTEGRKLAISFHVIATGPMTWHAKALQTSYLSGHRSGAHTSAEDDAAFPYTTTSWFFLDALDVMAPANTAVVCAFGDSITDGTLSTLNGDDRWPDVFSRRLHAAYGNRVSVVNAGIGGNRILTPESYPPPQPFAGGPSALQRLDRDLFGLSGLSGLVLLEGINDISAGASADAIIAGMKELVSRVRAKGNITIVGATITPSLTANGNSGTPEANQRRQAVNAFIRSGGLFDAVADFDAATVDPATGALREAFVPNSTIGGPGDRLHPNRAGYQAMGNAIDLKIFAPAR